MSKLVDHFARTYKVTSYLLNGNMNQQEILWEGASLMSGQNITLKKPISETKSGIFLVFSVYSNGAAQNYGWHHFSVPKAFVPTTSGGVQFNLYWRSVWGEKYLYIKDTEIKGGSDSNENNNKFCLRMVIAI